MYRKWYPPNRYIFYPLYRYFRRMRRWPCVLAYFTVWVANAFLHGSVLTLLGGPVVGLAWTAVSLVLGIVGVFAIIMKARQRISRVNSV